MATNKLTPDQASFEGGITGWEAVANPSQFVNKLSAIQASIETGSTTPAATIPGAYRGWSGGMQWARDPSRARHGDSSMRGSRVDALQGNIQPTHDSGTGSIRWPLVADRLYRVLFSWWMEGMPVGTEFLNLQNLLRGPGPVNLTGGDDGYLQWLPRTGEWMDLSMPFVTPPSVLDTTLLWSTTVAAGAGASLDRVAFYELGAYTPIRPGEGNRLTEQRFSIESGPTTPANTMPGFVRYGSVCQIARSTAQARDGASSLAINSTAATATVGAYAAENAAERIDVTPGEKLWIGVDVLLPASVVGGTSIVGARLDCYNAAGALVSVSRQSQFQYRPAGGAWTTILGEIVVPAGAVKAALLVYASAIALGDIVYFDRLVVAPAPTPPPFVMPGDIGVAIAQGTESAPHGTKVLRVSRTADSGVVEARTTPVAAVVGTRYTGMADLIGPTGSILSGSIFLDFLDGSGNVLVSPTSSITVTDQWTQARVVSAPAPAGTTQVRLRVRVPSVAEAAAVRVDRAGVMDAVTAQWVPGGATVLASVYVDPDPTRHVVQVAVLNLPAGAVDVQRVLPGGRIETVRNAQNLTPDATNAVLFDDYDAPTDTAFTYRVVAHGTTTVLATSEPVTLDSLGYFFLADPNTPAEAIRVIPAANAIPQMKREAPVGIHRVLGRPDPVVVTDTRWWASGDLTLYTLTNNQREEVGQMTSLGITLALYGPAEVMGGVGRLYFVAPTVDERRVSPRGTEQAREWHLEITQVAAPSTVPVTPPFVTWQDVVDSYATWQDVVNGEVDWLDVMQDVPTTVTAPPIGWEW